MAHSGKDGVVKVGSDVVAEVRSFSLDLSADVIDTSSMGTTARTYNAGLTTGTATVDCYWLETDTAQNALDPGSSVTLVLYPEGQTSGDTYFTGTALVTSKTINSTFDGLVECSFSAQYTGAVTETTV